MNSYNQHIINRKDDKSLVDMIYFIINCRFKGYKDKILNFAVCQWALVRLQGSIRHHWLCYFIIFLKLLTVHFRWNRTPTFGTILEYYIYIILNVKSSIHVKFLHAVVCNNKLLRIELPTHREPVKWIIIIPYNRIPHSCKMKKKLGNYPTYWYVKGAFFKMGNKF